jgi:potassium-transporting ATPase KdpC subunit
MRHTLITAVLYTLATTVLLGIGYPLVVTGLAQLLFRNQANGSLLRRDGRVIGSQLLGQSFTGAQYFHSRPSAAGSGYDAANSGGSNYAATNQKLIDRVSGDVQQLAKEHPGQPVPIDLVTASASGLDPDITPAAAEFQTARVAHARGLREDAVRSIIAHHTRGRQFGILGEPRVNVLALNLDLDLDANADATCCAIQTK